MIQQLLIKGKRPLRTLLFALTMVITCAASAQSITVTGTVTDEMGPLPGVTVLLQGTNRGVTTDFDGNYEITDVPSDGVLVFSYVGFTTQNVNINGRNEIDVVLEQDTEALEEVVVVGYGTQRREAVTGSVSSIGGEELREVPSANISEALQGRLPGVELSQTSSQPGAPQQIRIRGTRSLTASNDPLIVLNGVPFAGSLNDINPNDIQSMDILKDASATAIYGSRGANGVVLITTNTGRQGQEAQFSYDAFYGLKTVFGEYPMMSGPEFVALREAAGLFENGPDESDDVNTNWQDLLYEDSMITNHNIGVSGGTESGSYNASLGYTKDEAVLPEQYFERISFNATLNQDVGNYIRLGFSTNNNYSVRNGMNLGIYGVLSASPIASPYNEDGTPRRVISMAADDQWVRTRETIENLGDAWIDQTREFGTYNNFFGEVQIPGIEGLSYRINLGLNYRSTHGGNYTGQGVFSVADDTPSTASINNSITTRYLVENLVTYDRTFNDLHRLNVVGLYSTEETKFNSSSVAARDIPSEQFQFYNLGQATGEITIDPDNQGYYRSGLMSYMGRVMYEYDNRYMLSATLRSDGSSRLAEGHKWHTYPAISAGWNIGNESFMEDVDWMNSLKIRAGYGETSNQSVDPYSTLGTLATRPYNFGPDDYAVGYYVSQLPNPDLGWEFSTTYNFGVDFSLFNYRLTGTAEYYITNTNDILLNVGLPGTAGVGSYTANIGETQNKGFEISLNGLIIDNPDGFSWEAGLNLYSNQNELVELASGQDRDEANNWFKGHPINVIYDYERLGLWQEDDPYLDILEPGGNVGMIKVRYTGEFDENGVPVREIGPDDRQIIDVNPDFQGGFNTRFSYKNFDLTAVGAFQSGGVLISTLYGSAGYLNMLSGRRGNVDVDYWTPENTNARYPRPGGIQSGDNPQYGSTLGYFDASYLKIRTITLGYNFEQDWLESFNIDRLRLYSTVQNAFVFFSPYHDESGMDPVTNSYGNENSAVEGYPSRLLTIGTNTPSTRNYLIGLNLTF
ncbi:SusC/RagA family TonB-linked outer membrane protein [Salinimicrobium marinum]|uniref:SusC/RagA family TonB-linked outer membrane protein n=1 Tax=Salinimicrobium marinum TaxID=680283 RepID=A0A918VYH1_9FLAO|nr:TonB-dependent receptor [Salinimicrobium marinum]GHA36828.1 SusC/RagA family TonB-linked outer membrane protein [Salinimicrobium marinum]